MSLINIDGALIQAYIDIGQALSTAYEGAEFKPPSNTDWAAVFIVPASTAPSSSWISGDDEHLGFMQIDYNTRPGKGRASLIAYAQQALDQFVAGKSFTRSSQYVTIESASRSQIREVDGYLRVSVTINWIARTTRPEI